MKASHLNLSKVKVLLNHFALNTTFVVGNWCSNGCTTFHKNDSEHVFRFNGVQDYYSDDVRNLFSDDPIDFKYFINNLEDFDKLAGNYDITLLFALACDDVKYLKILLTNDSIPLSGDAKTILVKKNIDELSELLAKNHCWLTRLRVAETTENIDILTQLANDEDADVKLFAIKKLEQLK